MTTTTMPPPRGKITRVQKFRKQFRRIYSRDAMFAWYVCVSRNLSFARWSLLTRNIYQITRDTCNVYSWHAYVYTRLLVDAIIIDLIYSDIKSLYIYIDTRNFWPFTRDTVYYYRARESRRGIPLFPVRRPVVIDREVFRTVRVSIQSWTVLPVTLYFTNTGRRVRTYIFQFRRRSDRVFHTNRT